VVPFGFPLATALAVQPPCLTTMRAILPKWTQHWWSLLASLSFLCEFALNLSFVSMKDLNDGFSLFDFVYIDLHYVYCSIISVIVPVF
jgi:hypothetical protein